MRGKRGDRRRRVQIFSSLGCRETVLNDGTETTQIPNRKTTARRPNTKTRQQTQTLTQNMAKIGERICAQMIISLCKRLKDWQQNCRKKQDEVMLTNYPTASKSVSQSTNITIRWLPSLAQKMHNSLDKADYKDRLSRPATHLYLMSNIGAI